MKRLFVVTLALVFGIALLVGIGPFETKAEAKMTFVTIGTGGITGVYYPTGGAIARMVNAKRKEYVFPSSWGSGIPWWSPVVLHDRRVSGNNSAHCPRGTGTEVVHGSSSMR